MSNMMIITYYQNEIAFGRTPFLRQHKVQLYQYI